MYGSRGNIRSAEQRSWLDHGRMSESQRERLGREDRPPCFESDEQWVMWCIDEAAHPVAHSGYCYDCMASFQLRMVDNSQCEYPLTIFRAASNSSVVVGIRRRRAPPR